MSGCDSLIVRLELNVAHSRKWRQQSTSCSAGPFHVFPEIKYCDKMILKLIYFVPLMSIKKAFPTLAAHVGKIKQGKWGDACRFVTANYSYLICQVIDFAS